MMEDKKQRSCSIDDMTHYIKMNEISHNQTHFKRSAGIIYVNVFRYFQNYNFNITKERFIGFSVCSCFAYMLSKINNLKLALLSKIFVYSLRLFVFLLLCFKKTFIKIL